MLIRRLLLLSLIGSKCQGSCHHLRWSGHSLDSGFAYLASNSRMAVRIMMGSSSIVVAEWWMNLIVVAFVRVRIAVVITTAMAEEDRYSSWIKACCLQKGFRSILDLSLDFKLLDSRNWNHRSSLECSMCFGCCCVHEGIVGFHWLAYCYYYCCCWLVAKLVLALKIHCGNFLSNSDCCWGIVIVEFESSIAVQSNSALSCCVALALINSFVGRFGSIEGFVIIIIIIISYCAKSTVT